MGRGWGSFCCAVAVVLGVLGGNAHAESYRWHQGEGEDAFFHTFRRAVESMRTVDVPADVDASEEVGFTNKDITVLDEADGEFQRYLEELVLNAEDLQIEGHDGRLQVRMLFSQAQQQFAFGDRAQDRAFGEAYAVVLAREVRFAVFYSDEVLYANDLTGLQVLVNLPLLPDELILRQFTFNISTLQAAMRATALYDFVELVARASVRLRHFEGVDWFIPILNSLPGFFERARFTFNPTRRDLQP